MEQVVEVLRVPTEVLLVVKVEDGFHNRGMGEDGRELDSF